MEDVVNEICKSMREDTKRWLISTYTVEDRVGGVRYWIGYSPSGIDSIWTGSTVEKVFSDEQAYRILEAFKDLREIKESEAQKKILSSFKPAAIALNVIPLTSKKWWEFSK